MGSEVWIAGKCVLGEITAELIPTPGLILSNGYRVWGLGFRVCGLGFRAEGIGAYGFGLRVKG